MAVAVGDRVVVEVGAVAHGGHCVARHEGQVLFVRHALPGETVSVRVTSIGRKARFVRADAVEVLVAKPGSATGARARSPSSAGAATGSMRRPRRSVG